MNFCLTRCWIDSRPGCRQAGAGPPFRYSGPPGPCSCPEQGNNLPCYFSSPRSLIRHRLYRNQLIRRLFPGCNRRGARTVRPCSLRGNRGEQGKSPDRGHVQRRRGSRRRGQRAAPGCSPGFGFPVEHSVQRKDAATRRRRLSTPRAGRFKQGVSRFGLAAHPRWWAGTKGPPLRSSSGADGAVLADRRCAGEDDDPAGLVQDPDLAARLVETSSRAWRSPARRRGCPAAGSPASPRRPRRPAALRNHRAACAVRVPSTTEAREPIEDRSHAPAGLTNNISVAAS